MQARFNPPGFRKKVGHFSNIIVYIYLYTYDIVYESYNYNYIKNVLDNFIVK